jgi:hypothetical protein
MVDTFIQMSKPTVLEKSSTTATARFRTAGVAAAPTTARYRIFNLDRRCDVLGWTGLVAASEISIPITSTNTQLEGFYQKPSQRFELVVEADAGTDTATTDRVLFTVKNIKAVK